MAVKVRSRRQVFQVICYTPYGRSSSIKSCLPLKLVFCQGSYSAKGRLPLKVVFRQRSSSTPPLKADMGFFVVHGADTPDYVILVYC